jgi:hypothetical protein
MFNEKDEGGFESDEVEGERNEPTELGSSYAYEGEDLEEEEEEEEDDEDEPDVRASYINILSEYTKMLI